MKLWLGPILGLCAVCGSLLAEPYQGLLREFSSTKPAAPLDEYLVVASFGREQDAKSFISRIQGESFYPLSLDRVVSASSSCFYVVSGPHLDAEFFVIDNFKALGIHNAWWDKRKLKSGETERACSEGIDLLEEYLKDDYVADDKRDIESLIESTTELFEDSRFELKELHIPVKPPIE